MSQDSSDLHPNQGSFPGWNLDFDLIHLASIVGPSLERELEVVDTDEEAPRAVGGPLLAGKKLLSKAAQEGGRPVKPPGEPRHEGQALKIPITAKPAGRGRSFMMWAAGACVVALVLVVFIWIVIKTSDYTGVEVYTGSNSSAVQLSVDPGEVLPPFTGYLLVVDAERWGDTFSADDLIGINTVIFVWGSWNEELVTWTQDLNYQRLVELENASVQFVGLNLDRSREAALAVLNEDLVPWPHIFNYDERQEAKAHPMDVLGIKQSPLILVVDATGRLRAKGLTPNELVEAYRELFE